MVKSKLARSKRRGTSNPGQQRPLFSSQAETALFAADGCEIVSVGKRRDGGTRYWCLFHKADATAKYGRPAKVCRASHIAPIRPEDVLSLNIDKYLGGIALWGAVPAVYDTTRLPMERGVHVQRGKLRKVIANPLVRILSRLASNAPREPQHHDLGLMPETL
jgi:hypothetical protein